jgi:hypothetical protein
LDSLEGATADLGAAAVIVPGDLEESEAWSRIMSEDEDVLMPPPDSNLVLTAVSETGNLLANPCQERGIQNEDDNT